MNKNTDKINEKEKAPHTSDSQDKREVISPGTREEPEAVKNVSAEEEEEGKGPSLKPGASEDEPAVPSKPAKKLRGLASASPETRARVARSGGNAKHSVRGLQAADEETRKRVAKSGGEAEHTVRGLQGADEQTRKEVARKGGEARGRQQRGKSQEQ